MKHNPNRMAGVLMPVASLPGRDGAGTLGESAYRFVDILADTGFRIWQVLPLNPLGYGNSPYQPYSSYAGDPMYIDLDLLVEEGYLSPNRSHLPLTDRIDYVRVKSFRLLQLKQAFAAFERQGKEKEAFEAFCREESWVHPYAVFITLKEKNGMKCWNEWPEEQRDWIVNGGYDLSKLVMNIRFQMFLQYKFMCQWRKLKEYANSRGISLFGDIPFYVGLDSLDVWQRQDLFLLDERGNPDFVAGVPPDYFSLTGQRWGNPIYNWDRMQEDGFRFWLDRIGHAGKLYDYVRIDHFRAFDTFWKIPASCETAIEGEWIEPPGRELLALVQEKLPHIHLIAEDLGDLRPEVLELRDAFNLPGMNVAEFTLNLPERVKLKENQVSYTGTHDNQTALGWYADLEGSELVLARQQLRKWGRRMASPAERLTEMVLQSVSNIAIFPVMDLLELDDSARLNKPGSVGSPNWEWRLTDLSALERRSHKLRYMLRKSDRL